MKIAVLCQCHKNAAQVNRLINALRYRDVFDFYIHVDKKSSIDKSIICSSNVFVLSNDERVDVLWGDISQVEATLSLIRATHGKHYDYYWLISGQDFPIKSPEYIVNRLSQNPENSYIDLFQGKVHQEKDLKRNEVYYFRWMMKRGVINRAAKRFYIEITGGWKKTYSLFKRRKIKQLNMPFYFGSSWWCLNGKAIQWIVDYINNNPEYIKFYQNSLCPDESFFQTLFMNSPFEKTRKPYLTYVNWPSESSNPQILTYEDKDNILASQFLIARKFDVNVDGKIVEYLEKILGDKHEAHNKCDCSCI